MPNGATIQAPRFGGAPPLVRFTRSRSARRKRKKPLEPADEAAGQRQTEALRYRGGEFVRTLKAQTESEKRAAALKQDLAATAGTAQIVGTLGKERQGMDIATIRGALGGRGGAAARPPRRTAQDAIRSRALNVALDRANQARIQRNIRAGVNVPAITMGAGGREYTFNPKIATPITVRGEGGQPVRYAGLATTPEEQAEYGEVRQAQRERTRQGVIGAEEGRARGGLEQYRRILSMYQPVAQQVQAGRETGMMDVIDRMARRPTTAHEGATMGPEGQQALLGQRMGQVAGEVEAAMGRVQALRTPGTPEWESFMRAGPLPAVVGGFPPAPPAAPQGPTVPQGPGGASVPYQQAPTAGLGPAGVPTYDRVQRLLGTAQGGVSAMPVPPAAPSAEMPATSWMPRTPGAVGTMPMATGPVAAAPAVAPLPSIPATVGGVSMDPYDVMMRDFEEADRRRQALYGQPPAGAAPAAAATPVATPAAAPGVAPERVYAGPPVPLPTVPVGSPAATAPLPTAVSPGGRGPFGAVDPLERAERIARVTGLTAVTGETRAKAKAIEKQTALMPKLSEEELKEAETIGADLPGSTPGFQLPGREFGATAVGEFMEAVKDRILRAMELGNPAAIRVVATAVEKSEGYRDLPQSGKDVIQQWFFLAKQGRLDQPRESTPMSRYRASIGR